MAGANASRTLDGWFAGRPMETTFGIQTRYDDIKFALTGTYQRSSSRISAATKWGKAASASMARTRFAGLTGSGPRWDGGVTIMPRP